MAHDGSREGSDSALTTVRTVPSSGCVKNCSIPIGTYSSPNSSLDPGPDETPDKTPDEGPDKAPDKAPDEAPVATEPPVAVSSVSCFRGDGSVGTVVVFVFVVIVVIIAVVALVLGGGDAIIGGEWRGLRGLGINPDLVSFSHPLGGPWFSGVEPPLHLVLVAVGIMRALSSWMIIFETGVLVISRQRTAADDEDDDDDDILPLLLAGATEDDMAADLFIEGDVVEEEAMFLEVKPSKAEELGIPRRCNNCLFFANHLVDLS